MLQGEVIHSGLTIPEGVQLIERLPQGRIGPMLLDTPAAVQLWCFPILRRFTATGTAFLDGLIWGYTWFFCFLHGELRLPSL